MNLAYRLGHWFGRFVFFCTMRTDVLNARFADRAGGFVIALTHLSHVDPLACSTINRRHIDWMTRKEFFRNRVVSRLLYAFNAFRVDRQGIPVSAIRTAIDRVRRGRVVGICPEGGVTSGLTAAIRGGAIKRGCSSIAIRAAAPIVPCVMLGTDKLNAVGPWLPFRRARIWVAYGAPIYPPAGARSTRAARAAMATHLSAAYVRLYDELLKRYDLRDSDTH